MILHPTTIGFFLAIVAAIVIVWRAMRIPIRHRWRRRQARVMASQLMGRDRSQPSQLVYARLRAMDPLAFEELLLESFERRGLRVMRNRRYTGDGGIDGRLVLRGETLLIQAKRYSGAIRPEHVADFITLCRAHRRRGLFIHTGRTGPKSRVHLADGEVVTIISGAELIALLRGDPVAWLTKQEAVPGALACPKATREARR